MTAIAIQILQLAILLFQPGSLGIAQILENIVQVAAKAYQTQVGRPMDPSLIKPETAI